MTNILEIKNLRTQFFTQGRVIKAVDGVSYDVKEGETLAIVGESGCGKSVTALSVMGLIPWPPGKVTEGDVIFQGQPLWEWDKNKNMRMDEEKMRRLRGMEMSMVFQEPMTSLNPVLTIERQLTETVESHLDITPKNAVARAVEMMTQVGIPDPERRLSQYPHQFSGGMRQRVMIAMAMICNPRLILADEPTTALDVTIQAQILALMKNLSSEYGVAMILITHNLGIVARYADRVNVMYAGQIIERSTALEIYGNPKHPYTLGLLNSVPRLDQEVKQKLEPIEGQPPDLGSIFVGCRFLPRCKFGDPETCGKDSPPLVEALPGHWTACFKHDEISKSAQS